jgi:hypothetical protein
MIGSIIDRLFGCPHHRLTRPVTSAYGDTYVVCLECAQQFAYDLKEMRVGKRIRRKESAAFHSEMPRRPDEGR